MVWRRDVCCKHASAKLVDDCAVLWCLSLPKAIRWLKWWRWESRGNDPLETVKTLCSHPHPEAGEKFLILANNKREYTSNAIRRTRQAGLAAPAKFGYKLRERSVSEAFSHVLTAIPCLLA
jgi:hypothetical protein